MRVCFIIRLMGLGVALGLVAGLTACRGHKPPPPREGLAVAIIYDTSGSMLEPVQNAQDVPEAKYLVAQRAMSSILDLLAAYAFATNHVVEVELLTLAGNRAQTALPMRPFNAAAFKSWIKAFDDPKGGTPLGAAVRKAARDLLASPLTRKHVLVLTDGENTEGPEPQNVMPDIQKQAAEFQTRIQYHFVAFDVAAERFNAIKELGATVVSAMDEVQLKDQLEYIMQNKILLENEE